MSTHHGILLHVVFSTKYRKPLIADEWQDDLFAYIGGVVKDHKSTLLKSGGVQDHIHLLLRIHPEFAISKTVQVLKANSSRWINERPTKKQSYQWQRGYGAFSVSQSMSEKVKTYIANQREHHARKSFEDEYLAMLNNHGVDFDPQYVFEQEVIT